MRIIDEFKVTTNRHVYNITYKYLLSVHREINCGICRYNRGENSKRNVRRNWKEYRSKQYKNKEYND